jgi:hypothetical protein
VTASAGLSGLFGACSWQGIGWLVVVDGAYPGWSEPSGAGSLELGNIALSVSARVSPCVDEPPPPERRCEGKERMKPCKNAGKSVRLIKGGE